MLTIRGVPISVHTRTVIVTAIEKKLAYRIEPVIPFSPPPGRERLSPTGKIPVMVEGDVSLCDSTVICAYLDRAYPEHPAYPPGTRDHVQALWFEEYADGTVFRELVHPLFFQGYIRPNILKQEGDPAIIEATLQRRPPRRHLRGPRRSDAPGRTHSAARASSRRRRSPKPRRGSRTTASSGRRASTSSTRSSKP